VKEDGMLLSVDTEKTLAALREGLPKACAANKFGVLGVHDLKEKLKEKGLDYAGECLVFEVCNPQKAKQVLEADPSISTALPCRITAYRSKEGGMRLATLKPTGLVGLFGSDELKGVAKEVEDALVAILKAAAV
jgi:uncharacterized protein (DUF302 family)